jgi:hypothetical protein
MAAFGMLLAVGCGSTQSGERETETETEFQWICSGSSESCRCLQLELDEDGEPLQGFILLSGNSVEGCWEFDCCIFTEGDDDTVAECDCRMTDSESACEERRAATRGAEIVSECAPGTKRDLEAYAKTGERCDGGYLFDHDLWDCTPGTECVANDDNLQTCREVTPAMLECQAMAESATSGLQLATSVKVSTNTGEFEVTTVDGNLTTSDSGCVNSLDLEFEGDDGLAGCSLEVRAEVREGKLEVTYVTAEFWNCRTDDDALVRSLLETDPKNIPFTVSVIGETCDTGNETCLSGGIQLHLSGLIEDVEFAEATLQVEGVFCGGATPDAGVCP